MTQSRGIRTSESGLYSYLFIGLLDDNVEYIVCSASIKLTKLEINPVNHSNMPPSETHFLSSSVRASCQLTVGSRDRSPLNWDVLVTPGIPIATSDLPPVRNR